MISSVPPTPANTYIHSSPTTENLRVKSRFHLQYFKLCAASCISAICIAFAVILVTTRDNLDSAACSLVSFIAGSFLSYLSQKEQKNGPSN